MRIACDHAMVYSEDADNPGISHIKALNILLCVIRYLCSEKVSINSPQKPGTFCTNYISHYQLLKKGIQHFVITLTMPDPTRTKPPKQENEEKYDKLCCIGNVYTYIYSKPCLQGTLRWNDKWRSGDMLHYLPQWPHGHQSYMDTWQDWCVPWRQVSLCMCRKHMQEIYDTIRCWEEWTILPCTKHFVRAHNWWEKKLGFRQNSGTIYHKILISIWQLWEYACYLINDNTSIEHHGYKNMSHPFMWLMLQLSNW